MPYFERKPFSAETILGTAGTSAGTTSNGTLGEKSALVNQAAAILQKESQSAPAWSPPVNRGILPWPSSNSSSAPGIIPVVLQAAARVGQTARISVSLLNDSSDDVPYSFAFTDLIGLAGERISHEAIRAAPDTAIVPRNGAAETRFEIQIPNVPPGPYFGLVTCRETQPAILAVTVSA